MMEEQLLFKTKTGLAFPGVSGAAHYSIWSDLRTEYGLTAAQLCEAASFSQAMVIRFALGLSALGGQVFAIVDDCPSGWIAMAALRHLITAGAQGGIIIVPEVETLGADFELQVKPLQAMGADVCSLAEILQSGQTQNLVNACHNLICGTYKPSHAEPSENLIKLIEVLNDSRTPIHAVEVPPGIDPDSGKASSISLFASSTLSTGAPLAGLHTSSDYVGRHYLCDISCPTGLYKKHGADLSCLFAEQPVLQIFPVKNEENPVPEAA